MCAGDPVAVERLRPIGGEDNRKFCRQHSFDVVSPIRSAFKIDDVGTDVAGQNSTVSPRTGHVAAGYRAVLSTTTVNGSLLRRASTSSGGTTLRSMTSM